MFVESKVFTLQAGSAQKIIEKFSGSGGAIEQAPGFLGKEILHATKKGETEEVIVSTRWQDKAAFTAWKQSDAHRVGHQNKPKERPEFIVDVALKLYDVV